MSVSSTQTSVRMAAVSTQTAASDVNVHLATNWTSLDANVLVSYLCFTLVCSLGWSFNLTIKIDMLVKELVNATAELNNADLAPNTSLSSGHAVW